MYCKAVIFDLDGTILDTLEDLRRAMNFALKKNGYPEHDLEFIRNAIGSGVRELTRQSLPNDLQQDEKMIDFICTQMREYYMEHWHIATHPYEGIHNILHFLVDNGISVNVLSNKADIATQKMIPYWYHDIPFDYVLGERKGVPVKPDPTSAKEIASLLKISPDHILFVGDSAADILAAKGAGMHSMGVLWGYRTESVLRQAGAEFIAKTPQDIIDLIFNYPA